METTPRQLEDPVLEDYPVSHEALVRKMEQAELFTAHYEDASGKQNISMAFIPGDGISKETDIVSVAWSDSAHKDFNLLRHAALAEHTGADVLIVGFPGYDEGSDETLTPLQNIELIRKDNPSFSRVGKAQASAVEQTTTIDKMGVGYWKGREITIAGYSQGSSSEIWLLGHLPPEIADKVTDLFIWESPDALKPQSKTRLGAKFAADALKTGNRYFLQNEEVFGKNNATELGIHDKGAKGLGEFVVMVSKKRSKLLVGAADAMANSTLESDLEAVYNKGRLDDVRIHVINGDKSIVSPTEQNKELMRLLAKQTPKAGEKIHVVRSGGSHGAQESFPEYSSTVDALKK